MIDEHARLAKMMHRIYLMLYIQFALYWGTIAFGMVANYYYAVPDNLQPNVVSILLEIFTSPILLTHVAFGVLSTGMSIPIALAARTIGLRQVTMLHMGAMTARLGGFLGGPLFIYFSTSAISVDYLASVSTFVMAAAFITAVILSFMSRIFVVREDVRIKYGIAPHAIVMGGR